MDATESIRFQCPHCEKRLRVAAKGGGKRVRCPECAKLVDVPSPSDAEEESFERDAPRLFWPWFAGGGAALALLVGLVIWLALGTRKQSEPKEADIFEQAKKSLAGSAGKDAAAAGPEQPDEAKTRQCLALLDKAYSWSVSQSAPDIAKARRIQQNIEQMVKTAADLPAAAFAALQIDPKTTYLTIVPTKRDVDIEVMVALLGKASQKAKGELLQEPYPYGLSVTWHKHGWLEFGVAEGTVVAVRADCKEVRRSAAVSTPALHSQDTTPEVTAVVRQYEETLKKSPPPKELKQCIIAEADKFHMQAATVHAKNGSATVSVVTKESALPDDICCSFVALKKDADLALVGNFISELGKIGVIVAAGFPEALIQGLIWPNAEKSKGRLTVFEGLLAKAGHDVDTKSMPFNGYIALQLCQKKPALTKPVSNVLWVKVQVDK